MVKIKTPSKTSKRYHRHKPKGTSHSAFNRVYWPYIPVILAIGLLLTFGASSGMLQAAAKHPRTKVLAYASSMSIGGLLTDTNNQRSANGVASLSLNNRLDAAAQAKANDMATRDYWSHNTPEGNPPWVFVQQQGYDYQKVGENLATGFNDEQATIDGWMASAGHRENMLDSAYSEVGFGFANSSNYTSAGGGPMTVIVAYYGKPTVAAAPAPPPAPAAPVQQPQTHATNNVQTPSSAPVKTPAQATPAAEAQSPAPSKESPAAAAQPVTTQNPKALTAPSKPTTRAQVAFARLPGGNLLAAAVTIGVFAAAAIWLSRHALKFRRWIKFGERYVLTHPLLDVGLVVIGSLSFLLSQTAGIIR